MEEAKNQDMPMEKGEDVEELEESLPQIFAKAEPPTGVIVDVLKFLHRSDIEYCQPASKKWDRIIRGIKM